MISTTIITLNEEQNIKRVLESVKGLVQEIIIVDSGSSDKTREIAEQYGAKFFFRKFDNFANQKNWALSKVTSKWILSVDADEEIPQSLAEEVKEAIKNESFGGYLIPRKNIILGKHIKYSRWSPDKHIWLWQKNMGKWEGDVHEEVKVLGKVGELENNKIHFSHKTVSDFINSNTLYSTLLAKSMHRGGVKFSIWKMFQDALFEFSVRFVYKLGFLDGWRGFILSYLMAIYQLTVWVKLWELENQK